MAASPFIVWGNGDQLFRGTTKRTKRERDSMQCERFKWNSEKTLSEGEKKTLKLKLLSTEGKDSGRRLGSTILSPKDAEINLALNSSSKRQAVPHFYMSFFI